MHLYSSRSLTEKDMLVIVQEKKQIQNEKKKEGNNQII